MRAAAESGAVVSICHPKPFGPPWEYAGVASFAAVEVWNSDWPKLNSMSLAFWHACLRRGMRVVALGGSDTHYLHRRDPDPRHSQRLGTPTTWVRADRSVASVLSALRDGRAFVSESPRGPQIYLEPDRARAGRVTVEVRDGVGTTLQLVGRNGTIAAAAVDAASWDRSFVVPAGAAYVVAQLASVTGDIRAMTNAIWAEQL
jgi:hypothetical protein